jgi:predicted O-methyltransferase YrrM
VSVRRIGTWKDAVRRTIDATVASAIPGGAGLFSILAQVDGYLYPHEAVFLYRLARFVPGDEPIVEIGSFRGRSTLCLARGLADRGSGKVVSVDPHVYGTEADLRQNLLHFGAAPRVELRVERSCDVAASWSGPARAVFVDGNHDEAEARADAGAWLPHVRAGGYLLMHDATGLSRFPGPRSVAAEIFSKAEIFDAVGRAGTIAWGRIRGGASPWSPPERATAALDRLLDRAKGIRESA